MLKHSLPRVICVTTGLGMLMALGLPGGTTAQETSTDLIRLPAPQHTSATSVEQALTERHSVRQFAEESVTLKEMGQLLWAAQGVTRPQEERPSHWPPEWQWMGGRRTAPSAGALYPLEVYLVAGNVEGIDAGLYRYVPLEHALEPVSTGDMREALTEVSLRQAAIAGAPAVLVVAAVYQRVAVKYEERGTRYARIEVGAVAQSVYLQAGALDLGTVLIGAFRDAEVKDVLGLPADHEPLAIMPVGKRTEE
jgi:SagB-type dehydrogenase family enzyme